MTDPLRVLSLGGGLQSSTLAHMSIDGVVDRLDAIIFADTQNEMPETYEYLDYLQTRAESAGIRFIRTTRGNLRTDIVDHAGRGSRASLPTMLRHLDGTLGRIGGYHCSFNYKREMVEREVKRLCGKRGAWKHATVEQWIGYTTDEMSRMKPTAECRCGHKRARLKTKTVPYEQIHGPEGCTRCSCTGFDPWQINRWPLIEKLMRRGDCARWIREQGYLVPPRSACFFCPNRGNEHWRDLRGNRPDLWAKSVELDEFVRHNMNGLRAEAYLHASAVPLAEADLRSSTERARDHGIEPLPGSDLDMDCDSGVCFT